MAQVQKIILEGITDTELEGITALAEPCTDILPLLYRRIVEFYSKIKSYYYKIEIKPDAGTPVQRRSPEHILSIKIREFLCALILHAAFDSFAAPEITQLCL